jgi:Icc-related predicted phosphoesterase
MIIHTLPFCLSVLGAELESQCEHNTNLTVVCTSDTHGNHRQLGNISGDLLIHAGDFSMFGSDQDVRDFNAWLEELEFRHKIVIAGNHEGHHAMLPPQQWKTLISSAIFLHDESVTLDFQHRTVRVWGSSWQPQFYGTGYALSGSAIKEKWAAIPEGTHIVVTHTPPLGYGDFNSFGSNVKGCPDLLDAIRRVAPTLHVFGHLHEGAGQYRGAASLNNTLFVNAAVVDNNYQLVRNERTVLI